MNMYDFGKAAHRNLPIVKDTPKKTGKSFGLLSVITQLHNLVLKTNSLENV
jgi:hypothetical protein